MKSIFHIFYAFLFILINIGLLEGASGPDSSIYEIKKTYFKIGVNTHYLFNSTQIRSGFTGAGLLFELQFTPQFSLVGLFNTLNLKERKRNDTQFFPDFSDREIIVKLRYRKNFNRFSLFPEMGLGGWGRGIAIMVIGAGMEYYVWKNFSATLAINYNNVCERCLDIGGGGFTDSFFRFSISINYLITIKEKKKIIKPPQED